MYKIEKNGNTNSENIPFSETKQSNRELSKAYEQVIHKITRNDYHVKICLAFLVIR